MIEDAFTLLNIPDILGRLEKVQCFSVFDFAIGYHRMETHPDDRAKKAFLNPVGHFQYQ